jgi:hypothetical protein
MTESEWLACTNPTLMFEQLRGSDRATDRKLRLFAVAACRRIWPLLDDARSRMAVEIAEGFADGAVGEQALRDAAAACPPGADERGGVSSADWAALAATHNGPGAPAVPGVHGAAWGAGGALAAAECSAEYAAQALGIARGEGQAAGYLAERAAQAALLRDVFGNPSRPFAVHPALLAWHDGAIRKMAQAIYGERRFSRLSLVADALEEAGCADAAILAHCRGPGEHVRGCWAVDLLLGKE